MAARGTENVLAVAIGKIGKDRRRAPPVDRRPDTVSGWARPVGLARPQSTTRVSPCLPTNFSASPPWRLRCRATKA
jgi:hypothetical protein